VVKPVGEGGQHQHDAGDPEKRSREGREKAVYFDSDALSAVDFRAVPRFNRIWVVMLSHGEDPVATIFASVQS
jgi:hypothetical protein